MNYLITAAGYGSRFCREGIKPPKPLIRVKGRELLLWSLSSFAIGPGDSLYIATLRSHNVPQRLKAILKYVYPEVKVHWFELDNVLDGQLLTAYEVISEFNLTGPLIIHNCDTYHDATKYDFVNMLSNGKYFGIIPCFFGEGDHWSFVRTHNDKSDEAVEVAEKKRISNNCSVGTYVFSNAEQIVALCDQYIQLNSSPSQELFIAPLYQFAIEQGFGETLRCA